MDSHIQGPFGDGYGAILTQREFSVKFSEAAKTLGVIEASPEKPVLLEIIPATKTAFNGTTNVLTLGTTSANANELIAAADLDEAVVGPGTPKRFMFVARTTLYAKYTFTGVPSAGEAIFFVRAAGV